MSVTEDYKRGYADCEKRYQSIDDLRDKRIRELEMMLGTEKTMHAAWRKRAEECESANFGANPIGICQECHEEIGYWCIHQAWRDESGKQMFRHSINCTASVENTKGRAGSAETGGEQAAANPQLVIACLEEAIELFELDDEVNTPGTDSWLWKVKSEQALIAYAEAEASPTFPRSSQNQTASGGVEGAHAGTTADKSGSREPEKLNNAQKADELIDDLRLLLAGDFLTVKDRASARTVIAKWLAGSSGASDDRP